MGLFQVLHHAITPSCSSLPVEWSQLSVRSLAVQDNQQFVQKCSEFPLRGSDVGLKHSGLSRDAFKAIPKGARGAQASCKGFLCDALRTEGAAKSSTPGNPFPGKGLPGPLGSGTGLRVALPCFPLPLGFVTLHLCCHLCLGHLVLALLAVEEVLLEEAWDVALEQQEGSEHPWNESTDPFRALCRASPPSPQLSSGFGSLSQPSP